MDSKEKILLSCQYILGQIAIFVLAPLVYLTVRLFGYRVRNLRAIRKECGRHFKAHDGPWIVCANHLTNVDSVILAYAIAPMQRYMFKFKLLPWNLPERANFQRNILSTIMCYLVKCIPVSRGGDREEMKMVLEKCTYVLERGQVLLIFPEGGRSRTGRINPGNVSYGVGRFVQNFENCKVMCIYMRGDGQDHYSTIPRLGERFSVHVDVLNPERIALNGLRAQRYYAEMIINHLAHMEETYFASRRQRHSGLTASRCEGDEPEYPLHQTRFRSG